MNFLQLFVPFFQVVYVVLAVIMIGLILMQRGAGAALVLVRRARCLERKDRQTSCHVRPLFAQRSFL
jgi:hypothetical protein